MVVVGGGILLANRLVCAGFGSGNFGGGRCDKNCLIYFGQRNGEGIELIRKVPHLVWCGGATTLDRESGCNGGWKRQG